MYELLISYSLINPVISILNPDTALYFVGVPRTVISLRFSALKICEPTPITLLFVLGSTSFSSKILSQ